MKPIVEEPTQEAQQFEVSHCKHSEKDYSVSLTVKNRHVDLTSNSYSHTPGGYARIAIFDLTPDDIQRLGEMLITEALKIKAETT